MQFHPSDPRDAAFKAELEELSRNISADLGRITTRSEQVRVSSSDYPEAKERLRGIFAVNAGGFSEEDAISFEDYSSEPPTGIHLTAIGGSSDIQWRFRDLLASSQTLQQEYNDLKRRFEGKSMAKYREAKDAFVTRVLEGRAPA